MCATEEFEMMLFKGIFGKYLKVGKGNISEELILNHQP